MRGIRLHSTPERCSPKLEEILNLAQKGCKARIISVNEMVRAVAHLDRIMSNHLFKKDWVDLTVTVQPLAQSLPQSYKWGNKAFTTEFTIVRKGSYWTVTHVYRAPVRIKEFNIFGLKTKLHKLEEFALHKIEV